MEKLKSDKLVSFRLPDNLLVNLQYVGGVHGVPVSAVIKQLLQHSIEKAVEKAAKKEAAIA